MQNSSGQFQRLITPNSLLFQHPLDFIQWNKLKILPSKCVVAVFTVRIAGITKSPSKINHYKKVHKCFICNMSNKIGPRVVLV